MRDAWCLASWAGSMGPRCGAPVRHVVVGLVWHGAVGPARHGALL